ncbi:hypothetical protein G6F40_017883 [Rhizopus arrhizus]|nr:hypothetical protein G6F40_017883 [Rhizopus arrhizus]
MHRSAGQRRAHPCLGLPATQAGTGAEPGEVTDAARSRAPDAAAWQPADAVQPGRHAAAHGRCLWSFGGAAASGALNPCICSQA